jgi:hypothetical protein
MYQQSYLLVSVRKNGTRQARERPVGSALLNSSLLCSTLVYSTVLRCSVALLPWTLRMPCSQFCFKPGTSASCRPDLRSTNGGMSQLTDSPRIQKGYRDDRPAEASAFFFFLHPVHIIRSPVPGDALTSVPPALPRRHLRRRGLRALCLTGRAWMAPVA